MSYKVKLDIFEGPFDLLVYLIENAEMSIYDIQVSVITEQYLAHMGKMQAMNVILGSEFMVLAASLIEIKSKMLLPRFQWEGETALEEDPRLELVNRLLEYKRFKSVSAVLQRREAQNQGIFEKPKEDISQYTNEPEEYLNLELAQFVKAFHLFIRKKQKVEEIQQHYAKVERQKQSIESRISQMCAMFLLKAKKVLTFKEFLLPESKRYDVVLTFVSMLEMIRQKNIKVQQQVNFGEITITLKEVSDSEEEEQERGNV